MKKVEWRDIKDYEGLFQVSEFGEVRKVNGEIEYFSMSKNFNGIPQPEIILENKNKEIKRLYLMSYLVANAFVPNPNKLKVLLHKDYDVMNNHYTNLEWSDKLTKEEENNRYNKEMEVLKNKNREIYDLFFPY